jgi:hypothetical protein
MRLVTFTQAQAPHGVGDTRLVSDDVAKRLRDEGVIDGLGTPWPPVSQRPVLKPVRPVQSPKRPGSPLALHPAE